MEWADVHSLRRILRVQGLDAWLHTPSNWYVKDAAAPHVQREQGTLAFAAAAATFVTASCEDEGFAKAMERILTLTNSSIIMKQLHVHRDHDALVRASADFIAEQAGAAVAATGRFTLVLAGGSTPAPIYAHLATSEYLERVRWAVVQVFFGDERCVSPDDEHSNYGMARDALLDRVPIPSANVHRILGESDPADAAKEYEQELRRSFGGDTVPSFDLICLGMGDNGHTASLFPETEVLEESTRWVAPQYVEEVGAWRVTMTPVILNAARKVVFLVEGAGKAAMLRRVLRGPHQPRQLPAQLVDPEHGEVHWMVDAAAAGNLGENLDEKPDDE